MVGKEIICISWHNRPVFFFELRSENELYCTDPKDGELYLRMVKSGEILMEASSVTDVQIVRMT